MNFNKSFLLLTAFSFIASNHDSFAAIHFSQPPKNSLEPLSHFYIRKITAEYKKSIVENQDSNKDKEPIEKQFDFLNGDVFNTSIAYSRSLTEGKVIANEDLLEVLYSRMLGDSVSQHYYFKKVEPIMLPNVWEDLGLIAVKSTKPDQSLANLIAEPKSMMGKMQIGLQLITPTTNIEELKRRQRIIRYFKDEKPEAAKKLTAKLDSLRLSIQDLIKFWSAADNYSEKNPNLLQVRSQLSPKGTGKYRSELNSIFAKTAGPFFGTIIPLPAVINAIISPSLDSVVGGFIAVALGITSGITFQKILTNPHLAAVAAAKARLRSVRDVVRLAESLREWIKSDSQLTADLSVELADIDKLLEARNDKQLKQIFADLQHPSIDSDAFFSRAGIAIQTLFALIDEKAKFNDTIMAIGRIDAYLAIARRMNETNNLPGQVGKISFTQYDENAEQPHVALTNFWSPFLSVQQAVTNSIELGGPEKAARVGIISGPNAGGKSTAMKAVAYNVLLSQTFGIAFADSVVMTPFSNITTYMNITDDVLLGQSLFKAEVTRTKAYLETLTRLKPGQFSFSAMDEVFSGTNPEEGAATAYSAIHHIGKNPQVISLVATHYKKVTLLPERTKDSGIFTNFHVSLVNDSTHQLVPDFKLNTGSTDQKAAILILRNEGLATEILDEALEVLDQ